MKKYLILILLIPVFVNAQQTTEHERNFVIKEGQVRYEKIFEEQNMSKKDLFMKLSTFIPTIPGISQFNADSTAITARLIDAHVPYQKYGGHLIGGWAPTKVPLTANVTILIKDNKYRVIIAGIIFDMNRLGKDFDKMTLEELATVKKRSQFKRSAIVVDGLILLQNYFTATFNIKGLRNNDNW